MPASRSFSRGVKPAPRSRSYGPLIAIGLAAVLAVIIAVLPASLIMHFLPPIVGAEDFSGSIWHGSAGRIRVGARDAGALEWRLHPAALVGMAVAADLHWVKLGFVIDAAVKVDRQGFAARDIKGGGPIDDLQDLGVATGWRGTADVNLKELRGEFAKPLAASGDIHVSNLTSAQVAAGADLGSYDLKFGDGAVAADGGVTAQLIDTGGPLDIQALIHLSTQERRGMLSGTLSERPDASAALRSQIQQVSQLRGRDPQGRIPVDLEFAF
jgi:Type II secretion system (T2SS), protein N